MAACDEGMGFPTGEDSDRSPDEELSDVLLARAQDGDAQALDRLFGRHLSPLRRWARRRLPQWARDLLETDDLVQEAMLRTVRHVAKFKPRWRGALQDYLRTALLNCIRDEIRRVGRLPFVSGIQGTEMSLAPSPWEETVGRETARRYVAALARLDPEDREAVVCRVERGYSYPELAEALGKPTPDAARMAASRALLRL